MHVPVITEYKILNLLLVKVTHSTQRIQVNVPKCHDQHNNTTSSQRSTVLYRKYFSARKTNEENINFAEKLVYVYTVNIN